MELFTLAVALVAFTTTIVSLSEYIGWEKSYKERGEDDRDFHNPDNSPHEIDYLE